MSFQGNHFLFNGARELMIELNFSWKCVHEIKVMSGTGHRKLLSNLPGNHLSQATTSSPWPLFQNTKLFSVKSLQMERLVGVHP